MPYSEELIRAYEEVLGRVIEQHSFFYGLAAAEEGVAWAVASTIRLLYPENTFIGYKYGEFKTRKFQELRELAQTKRETASMQFIDQSVSELEAMSLRVEPETAAHIDIPAMFREILEIELKSVLHDIDAEDYTEL